MAFAQQLAKTAKAVEHALDQLLAPNGTRLMDAMRYAALAQGKRIRPFFVMESSRLLGADPQHALRVAAALECVHCYSLVHDDLPAMDDDDLRRGRPTTHIAYDEATAILAGDALLTIAFEILSHPATHPDPAVRAELVLKLAQASGAAGMAGGQMLDIQAEKEAEHGLEKIVALQSMKTGALFRFALEAGAILARAEKSARDSLVTYAENVGLAFQIADDVLDHESTPETLGKAVLKDAAKGKATFIDLLGKSGAKKRADALVLAANEALIPFAENADLLRQAANFITSRKN
ncbi:MAG: polyprenyl synthetase family protein [Aestuariivirgaceae bacterium]|nr:polyprenyl synthetase family protein [Aestuariivirgaceae bacterium]